jgi:hypothetical protein
MVIVFHFPFQFYINQYEKVEESRHQNHNNSNYFSFYFMYFFASQIILSVFVISIFGVLIPVFFSFFNVILCTKRALIYSEFFFCKRNTHFNYNIIYFVYRHSVSVIISLNKSTLAWFLIFFFIIMKDNILEVIHPLYMTF